MTTCRSRKLAIVLAAGLWIPGSPAPAVILFATADPERNTTPPVGPLRDSGWQWVGRWQGGQGTAVSPRHFLTARHIGGQIGDPFVWRDQSFVTIRFVDDPVSDLRLCEVDRELRSWAPLYRGDAEVGQTLIVFGRGLTRGAEIRDAAAGALRGWHWGTADGRLRWGTNTVQSVVTGRELWGELLYATFDARGGEHEAHLARDDSSGPVFIRDEAGWKLAGIAAVVDASFNLTGNGAGFTAAIFDARGLYFGQEGTWRYVVGPKPVPSGFYATRISARITWLDSVLAPR